MVRNIYKNFFVFLLMVFSFSLCSNFVFLNDDANAWVICKVSGLGQGTNCRVVEWLSDYTWKICNEDYSGCQIKEVEHHEFTVRNGIDQNGIKGDYVLKNNIDAYCVWNNPGNCWEHTGQAWLTCDWTGNVVSCHVENEMEEALVWNTVTSGSFSEYLVIKPVGKLATMNKVGLQSFYVGTIDAKDMRFHNKVNYNDIYNFSFTADELRQYGVASKTTYTTGGRVEEYLTYTLDACIQYNWGLGGGWSAFWADECRNIYIRQTLNGVLRFNATSSLASINGDTSVSDKQWEYKNQNSKAENEYGVNEGTVVVSFNHNISPTRSDIQDVPVRAEVGTQYRIRTFNGSTPGTYGEWTTLYGPNGSQTTDEGQRIATYRSTNLGVITDNVVLNDFKLGQEAEICQRIAYDSIVRVTTTVDENGNSNTTTSPLATNDGYTILKDENGNEIVAGRPMTYSNWACVTIKGIRNMSEFEGYSAVEGGEKTATTDWTRASKTANLKLTQEQCGNGCNVTFTHGLRRRNGNGTGNYTLYRISKNGYTIIDRSESGTVAGNQMSASPNTVSIVPGEMVCESLRFDNMIGSTVPNSDVIDFRSQATTKACAYVVADFDSNIDAKIRNKDVSAWSAWSDDTIYARPGNNLELMGTYYTSNQHTAVFKPAYTQIGTNGSKYENNGKTVRETFDSVKTSAKWKNVFSFYSNTLSDCKSPHYGTIGFDNPINDTASFVVAGKDVGSKQPAAARTNWCSSHNTTPRRVQFVERNEGFTAIVDTGSVSDYVYYLVPYNFNTEIVVPKPKETEKIIYAGERKDISGFQVKVTKRQNGRFNNESYATIMKDAEVRLISYVGSEIKGGETEKNVSGKDLCNVSFGGSSNCTNVVLKQENGSSTKWTFNRKYDINGGDPMTISKATVTATDARAGTQYCVALAVYPSSSGDPNVHDSNGDLQMDTSGSKRWRISDSVCYTVAKKPSLQVWGGNFYSSKNVTTSVSTKYILNGGNSSNAPYIFGSWVEGAIVSNGEVRGLASGASTGYRQDGSSMGLGGISKNTNFCYRSPLSFATVSGNCNSLTGYVGKIGKSTQPGDKAEILERFVSYDDGEAAKTAGIVKDENDYVVLNNETISGMSIQKGTTKIFKRNGTINITGDIIYDGSYNSLAEVPKVIIYANGNIDISCNVTRIDALLISDETVRTCSEINDDNSGNNDERQSKQLKINGAIIANKLIARRTYGASTGKNSVIPAEIVDYDSTFYLWGAKNAEAAKSGTLSNVYLRELSPRY